MEENNELTMQDLAMPVSKLDTSRADYVDSDLDVDQMALLFDNSDLDKTIEEFKEFIKSKHAVIEGFWKQLDKDNSMIIELNYEDNFNPIFIDMNDFQFLMPPIMLLPPYTAESINRILEDITQGQICVSEFPSYVIQAHLPYIEKRNVINIYPMFELNE